ncbi:MAG: hypothetical protein PHR06_08220, partial [Candidatus Cloacimonetes bacterium]|nr:hypothetical protein [Candidatus Cloacimonadota bacterium]
QKHEESKNQFVTDPFIILPQQIAIFEGINLALNELFSVPQIVMFLNPRFFYNQNFMSSTFRQMFSDIGDANFRSVKKQLSDIQKGINLMIYDLIQSNNNMQSGGGGGMESLMQMLQQSGQQQMAMNMMTEQLMQQMSQNGGRASQQMREQMQRLANEEQRLADNLKRALQSNPEAQKQSSAINKIIEDLEAVSRKISQGRIDNSLLQEQQKIISRLLDAQKSVHKREFSKQRKGTTNLEEQWDSPENIELEFEKMRKKIMLEQDFKNYPKEYQELIKEYLRILNEKAVDESD